MKTKLHPYLDFKSYARQAMEFYKSVFGGKLKMNTFKDYHLHLPGGRRPDHAHGAQRPGGRVSCVRHAGTHGVPPRGERQYVAHR